MPLWKWFLGATGIGGGVSTPTVINKLSQAVPRKVAKVVNQVSGLSILQEKLAESKEDKNVQQALKKLIQEQCKSIKNPQKVNNGFEELYACKKGSNNKTDFYYFGSRDSFNLDSDSHLFKVVKANYQEVQGQDQKNAKLVLTLDTGRTVDWNIASGSGWKYFKDVNLSEKCEIKTKLLGGDDLYCELKGDNDSTFYYSFSVF